VLEHRGDAFRIRGKLQHEGARTFRADGRAIAGAAADDYQAVEAELQFRGQRPRKVIEENRWIVEDKGVEYEEEK
jgi:hypothetical protein